MTNKKVGGITRAHKNKKARLRYQLIAQGVTPILSICKDTPCDGCFYTDECRGYAEGNPTGLPFRTYAFVQLCEGRHECAGAKDGSIFPSVIDSPTNTEYLEVYASIRLQGIKELNLFVTGLTVALVAVLNVCHEKGIKVTLWHYDRDTNDYFPQEVIS